MKRSMAMIAAAAACALATAAPAVAESITVNCNAGKTVGAVLAKKEQKDKPLVLRVLGTCAENVTIDRDDVTLDGDAGATIQGGIIIDGSQRVVIANLTITNPTFVGDGSIRDGTGVFVTNGGSATIRDNFIKDSRSYGIFVQNGSFANVNRNQVRNNGLVVTLGNGGIGVRLNSNVRALENEIEDNFISGIQVFDNSSYRSEGDIITAKTPQPQPPAITYDAVEAFRAGYVDLRRVSVTGQVSAVEQSQIQFRNVVLPDNTIAGSSVLGGNIIVNRLSIVRLRAATNVTGTVFVDFPGMVFINNLSIAQSDANMTCIRANNPTVPLVTTFCQCC